MPSRVECAVEASLAASSAHERADVARLRVERDERALGSLLYATARVLRFSGDERCLAQHGAIRTALRGEVQRGVDGDVAVLECIGADGVDEGADRIERQRFGAGVGAPFIFGDLQRGALVALGLCTGDVAILRHE